jgi:chemotaxis protein MotB
MSENEGNRPIIVIKKKKGGHGHHGGAWKVAYADFVTAMMAFFLVMWLVAQSQKVKTAVAGYFRDPDAYMKNAGILPGGKGLNEGAAKTKIKEMEVDIETAVLEKAARQLKDTIDQSKILDGIKKQVEMTITKDGLEIQLLEKANQVLFDVGSTVPKETTKVLLAEIGREIGRLPNRVVISGHTDRRPYHDNAVFSNWELSCERANSARRVMAENGLRPEQIARVAGFADTVLKNPEDPFAASNRRISIMVLRSQAPIASNLTGAPAPSAGEEKPEEKTTEKPAEKPAEKVPAKPFERPVEKPTVVIPASGAHPAK